MQNVFSWSNMSCNASSLSLPFSSFEYKLAFFTGRMRLLGRSLKMENDTYNGSVLADEGSSFTFELCFTAEMSLSTSDIIIQLGFRILSFCTFFMVIMRAFFLKIYAKNATKFFLCMFTYSIFDQACNICVR